MKETQMTDFQKNVYSLLKEIPLGKVTTYKILAEKLGVKAYRAVGSACGKNPFAPQVPCHRVVCSDGKLGGYSGSGGLKRKIELLEDEGIKIKENKVYDFNKVVWRF